jgi:hypothetical protein
VTDAAILIPTHDHAALLPYALRSALVQKDVEVEVLVVGDGVGDDTRAALGPFLDDPRVRFFDRIKGDRHGERLRHDALQESSAPIVCYLSDDDLLLPDHVARMRRLLADADMVRGLPAYVTASGELRYHPFDLALPEFRELLAHGLAGGGLTGISHTRELYDRLQDGWSPAPPDLPTDVHMLQKLIAVPGFRGATDDRLTALVFPSPLRRHMTTEERVAELERWSGRLAEPAFREELDTAAGVAAAQAARRQKLKVVALERELARIQASRWWRARRAVAELRPVRAFRARRHGGR